MNGEFDQPSGLRSDWSAEKREECKREATSKERVVEGNGSAFYGRAGRKKGKPLRDTRRAATSLHSMRDKRKAAATVVSGKQRQKSTESSDKREEPRAQTKCRQRFPIDAF